MTLKFNLRIRAPLREAARRREVVKRVLVLDDIPRTSFIFIF
jgi:hypothetical protein